jgi:hypothetical protein
MFALTLGVLLLNGEGMNATQQVDANVRRIV